MVKPRLTTRSKSDGRVNILFIALWGDNFDNLIILRDGERSRSDARVDPVHCIQRVLGVLMMMTNKEMMVKDCILFIAITILKLAKVKLRLMTTV